MDPRQRANATRESLIAEGKNVILITSSIHSTEVGGFLTPLVLADRLARAETAEARSILANTIVILVPSSESRRRGHRGRLVSQHHRHARRRQRSAGALSLLHGARQQPGLVRVHAGGDALRDRFSVHALEPADRQRYPSTGSQWRADLHSSLHGSRRAEHRPRPDHGHQRTWHGHGVAPDGRRQTRSGDQRVVRSVVAGPAVLVQPSRRPHSDGNRQRQAGNSP